MHHQKRRPPYQRSCNLLLQSMRTILSCHQASVSGLVYSATGTKECCLHFEYHRNFRGAIKIRKSFLRNEKFMSRPTAIQQVVVGTAIDCTVHQPVYERTSDGLGILLELRDSLTVMGRLLQFSMRFFFTRARLEFAKTVLFAKTKIQISIKNIFFFLA